MTKDDVLAALPELSQSDLATVIEVAKSLLGDHTVGLPVTLSEPANTVFNALTATLGINMAYSSVAHSRFGKMFVRKCPILVEWLNANFQGWQNNKIVQMAFLRWLFSLLNDDLKANNLKPSFGMAVINLDRLPKIVDASFPGYLKADLGAHILASFG